MAKFCLVIILAIYASVLVASEPPREDGLGALSKEDPRAIDAPSYPGWKAIISYLPIKVKAISFVSTGYYPVMHSCCNFKITGHVALQSSQKELKVNASTKTKYLKLW